MGLILKILFNDINYTELNKIFKTKLNPYSLRASATLIEKTLPIELPLDMSGVADLHTLKKKCFYSHMH